MFLLCVFCLFVIIIIIIAVIIYLFIYLFFGSHLVAWRDKDAPALRESPCFPFVISAVSFPLTFFLDYHLLLRIGTNVCISLFLIFPVCRPLLGLCIFPPSPYPPLPFPLSSRLFLFTCLSFLFQLFAVSSPQSLSILPLSFLLLLRFPLLSFLIFHFSLPRPFPFSVTLATLPFAPPSPSLPLEACNSNAISDLTRKPVKKEEEKSFFLMGLL